MLNHADYQIRRLFLEGSLYIKMPSGQRSMTGIPHSRFGLTNPFKPILLTSKLPSRVHISGSDSFNMNDRLSTMRDTSRVPEFREKICLTVEIGFSEKGSYTGFMAV